ncbi:MAG: hypothetical protein Q9170_001381 [Blastenia crenularia]
MSGNPPASAVPTPVTPAPVAPDETQLLQVIKAGDEITYHFGYRSVFFRPNDTGGTSSEACEKQLDETTVPTTIVWDQSIKTINIFAEEIVFVTGAQYAFRELSLSIRCRCLRIIRLSDSPVKFDLTGRNNETAPVAPAAQSNGRNANGTFVDENPLRRIGDHNFAESGPTGTAGTDGSQGNGGGKFFLQADVKVDNIDQPRIEVNVSGGAGGSGGVGGKGGKGGSGVKADIFNQFPVSKCAGRAFIQGEAFSAFMPLLPAARGGDGGVGGKGGWGGNAGSVQVKFTLNGQTPTDDQKKLFNMVSSAGIRGANGKVGKPATVETRVK